MSGEGVMCSQYNIFIYAKKMSNSFHYGYFSCCIILLLLSMHYFIQGCCLKWLGIPCHYKQINVIVKESLCPKKNWYSKIITNKCSVQGGYFHDGSNLTCDFYDKKITGQNCCSYLKFYYPEGKKISLYLDMNTLECIGSAEVLHFRWIGFYLLLGSLMFWSFGFTFLNRNTLPCEESRAEYEPIVISRQYVPECDYIPSAPYSIV